MSHIPTGPLWERIGYLNAQAVPGHTVFDALRVVLTALDEDTYGDVVSLHSDLWRALMGEDYR